MLPGLVHFAGVGRQRYTMLRYTTLRFPYWVVVTWEVMDVSGT
jgi:hypothetical protein